MNAKRIFRHLRTSPLGVRTKFNSTELKKIEELIAVLEKHHYGEIRVVIEDSLSLNHLLRNRTARDRAVEIFSDLRVWDTEKNSGVLLYLLVADREFEIVSDRGLNKKVAQSDWEEICKRIEEQFRAGNYMDGLRTGVSDVSELLKRHCPLDDETRNRDELPNNPVRF